MNLKWRINRYLSVHSSLNMLFQPSREKKQQQINKNKQTKKRMKVCENTFLTDSTYCLEVNNLYKFMR